MGVLDSIVAGVLEDLAPREAALPLAELKDAVLTLPPTRDPMPAFRAPRLSVIAEVKRSSPSKGALAPIEDPAALAAEYQAGGADAISVLTERRRFGGTLADLVAVRSRVATPVLRKDFIVTDYQLYEARVAGPDPALLIVAALDDERLVHLLELCRQLMLTPLVEVHTQEEAERAVATGAALIGVNNRNLQTLEVEVAQFGRIAEAIPVDRLKVAESGIISVADVETVSAAGADVILVGEALVRAGDPRTTLAEFITAGTAARR